MTLGGILFLAAVTSLQAQEAGAISDLNEAFRLAGVHGFLASLPIYIKEASALTAPEIPNEKRLQFGQQMNDVSLKFRDTDGLLAQVRSYFARHYDASQMAGFVALERTPSYRTMHLMEAAAQSGSMAAERNFEVRLKSDPPDKKRVEILGRLDDATNTADLEIKIVRGVLQAMSFPANEGKELTAKVRPPIAEQLLHHNLYTYRNADDSELEDYVQAALQPAVTWFNRTLQDAILAVAAEGAVPASDPVKTKITRPFN